ncbi:MAG: FAD-dependent oxidoreductase, partial [Myxococcales bacterium]
MIAIFGAGPVGSLLALFLARRGHEVVVYERRSDPRLGRATAGRSINLAVSTRGLYALHQMGLD